MTPFESQEDLAQRVVKADGVRFVPVHTNVRDVRDVMSGMYEVVVRCIQYLCW